uniref:Uncharacterized protein n=2 Tax=Arion vulgaris TaxID=1028688 RepID=A0A0B7BR32_9EUPU
MCEDEQDAVISTRSSRIFHTFAIMPPKRKAIGPSTPRARKRKALLASETDEQQKARLQTVRVRTAEARSS